MKRKKVFVLSVLLFFLNVQIFALVDYAENFKIYKSGNEYVLEIDKQIFRYNEEAANSKNSSQFILMSTVYAAMFEAIETEDMIIGLDSVRYISSEKIKSLVKAKKIKEVAINDLVDLEQAIMLQADCLIAPQGFADIQTISIIEKSKVQVFYFKDWLESHPLARLEWIKLIGLLTGQFDKSCLYFEQIESSYLEIVELAKAEIKTSPQVLLNLPYMGVWYIPGERNYLTQFIKDANALMFSPSPNNKISGSLALDPEVIISQASDCDFWFVNNSLYRGRNLASIELEGKSLFKAYRDGQVFNNDKNSKGEGLSFYELGVVRPDLVLKDFYLIFKNKSDEGSYFFRRM